MQAAKRQALTSALSKLSEAIAQDLRTQMLEDPAVRARARQVYTDEAVGDDFAVWTDLLSRRAAVLWVLKSVYVRVLEDRGLLDETLVVAVGEIGRTPQGNAQWGRGHWSHCFPAVLAGAGIRGGIAYGTSDRHAAYPIDRPTSPEDLAATIYTALGINPRLRLPDRLGRPVDIVDGGRPLLELFS